MNVTWIQDRQEREEEERKRRLQLYVFVSRCVAYPFNAKQPTDMTKRQLKVTKQQLESLQQRFQVNNQPSFTSFHFTFTAIVVITIHNRILHFLSFSSVPRFLLSFFSLFPCTRQKSSSLFRALKVKKSSENPLIWICSSTHSWAPPQTAANLTVGWLRAKQIRKKRATLSPKLISFSATFSEQNLINLWAWAQFLILFFYYAELP